MDLLPSSGEIYWGTYSVGSDRAAITMSAKYTYMDLGSIGTTKGRGGAAELQASLKAKSKNHRFCRHDDIDVST